MNTPFTNTAAAALQEVLASSVVDHLGVRHEFLSGWKVDECRVADSGNLYIQLSNDAGKMTLCIPWRDYVDLPLQLPDSPDDLPYDTLIVHLSTAVQEYVESRGSRIPSGVVILQR
jgi:hypothetical protein